MDTRLRQAIARIDVMDAGGNASRGTGFLVAPDLVLTAFHVVADRHAPALSLYPGRILLTFPTHSTEATVVDGRSDSRSDWILLRCVTPPRDVRPIPLAHGVNDGASWETFGFPEANPRDGMVHIGTVANASGTFEGVPAHQLFSQQAAAGTGAPVKGLSGGPVIVEGIIVGLLRSALLREGQNVAGTLYGCPINLIFEHCDDLLPRPIPLPTDLTQRLRNRRDFLDDVKSEVEDRLAQSLHTKVMLTIPKDKRSEQVRRPWDFEVKVANQPRTPLPPAMGIVAIFDDQAFAGKLLILGEPGSGKTTTLLELTSELIRRAELDAAQPMPVLLNLSSWRDNKQTFAGWLVDELKVKHGVRKDNGKAWLDERSLLPLLDGLDEVDPTHQQQCLRAINQFQQDYRLKHLVVCCRVAEYENYGTKLQLNGAVHLMPLADDQLHRYLADAGCRELWQGIRTDPELLELARSPLLLSMMVLANKDSSEHEWQSLSSVPDRQAHLFEVYTRHLLSRDAMGGGYPADQTRFWLAWLATQLKMNGKTEFLLEQLQPDCLQSTFQRWLYRLGVVLSVALAFGIAWSLSIHVFDAVPRGRLGTMMQNAVSTASPSWSENQRESLIVIVIGLAIGLIVATRTTIRPIETLNWSGAKAWEGMRRELRRGAIAGFDYFAYVGFAGGLVIGAVYIWGNAAKDLGGTGLDRWSSTGPLAAAIALVPLAVALGLTVRPNVLLGGLHTRSTERAANALLSGLVFGVIMWMSAGSVLGVAYALCISALVGLNRDSTGLLNTRFPRALIIGVTACVGSGLISGLMGEFGGLVTWMEVWSVGGLGVGAGSGLLVGLIARSRRTTEAVEAQGLGIGMLVRQWGQSLMVGAAIAVITGVTFGLLARSGQGLLVRGIALATAKMGLSLSMAVAFTQMVALSSGVGGALSGSLLGALYGVLNGLTGPDVARRSVPNQGIRQSAVNVGVFALLGWVIVGLPYGLLNVASAVVIFRTLPDSGDWIRIGLGGTTIFAILGGLVPGAACIQHVNLRFVLWCFGLAPRRYGRFLNYATSRMFLQRVGGRYRFIHALLRDHFAGMHP